METLRRSQSKAFGVKFFKSKALHDAIGRIGPDLYAKSVTELEQLAAPTETLEALKFRYWSLVSRGLETNETFTISKLHGGICSYNNLYYEVLTDPAKVAWMLTFDSNYETLLEVLKNKILNQISDFIRVSTINEDGSVNYSQAKLVVNTFAKLLPLLPHPTPKIYRRPEGGE